MPGQATVTGKIGPGGTLTAQVFPNLATFSFDTNNKVLTLIAGGVETKMDVNAATTVTCTIAAGNYTLTVS